MKKTALLLAGLAASLVISGTAFAQPAPHRDGPDMRHPPHHMKKKVWIRAHREHGHMVPGHYVWR